MPDLIGWLSYGSFFLVFASTFAIIVLGLNLQGVLVGSRRHQIEMIRAIDANGMRPVIDRHFSLEEIVAAFRHQESNKHFGKICLDI